MFFENNLVEVIFVEAILSFIEALLNFVQAIISFVEAILSFVEAKLNFVKINSTSRLALELEFDKIKSRLFHNKCHSYDLFHCNRDIVNNLNIQMPLPTIR